MGKQDWTHHVQNSSIVVVISGDECSKSAWTLAELSFLSTHSNRFIVVPSVDVMEAAFMVMNNIVRPGAEWEKASKSIATSLLCFHKVEPAQVSANLQALNNACEWR